MRQNEIITYNLSNPPSIVETDGVIDYVTPDKYKKQIRQRTHDARKSLPKSPGLQTCIVNRLMKKYINSPKTRPVAFQIVQRHTFREVIERQRNHKLQRLVFEIHKFKIRKDKIKLRDRVIELLKFYSIRQAAKKLGMHYTTLQRWLKIKNYSGERAVTETNMQSVLEFYQNSRISLQLPNKRYANNYYLHSPLVSSI